MGLPQLIDAAAAARGAALGPLEAFGCSTRITEALKEKGLRMLLLVDEVDELYRVNPSVIARREPVFQTLGRLGALGDGFSGRYGVLLCGSSSSTFTLVCGGTSSLAEWFPMVREGIPDLNGSKFSRKVVPSSQCTAVDEVARMLASLRREPEGTLPVDLLPQARLFAFFVGASPRAIVFAVKARNEPGAGLDIATPSPGPRLSEGGKALYYALLEKLVARNAALRSLVRDKVSGGVNLASIMDGSMPWEKKLVPLSGADVEAAWGACGAGAAMGDPQPMMHRVRELADHQLFFLQGAHVKDLALWPITAAQVCCSDEERQDWATVALSELKGLLDLAVKVVGVAN